MEKHRMKSALLTLTKRLFFFFGAFVVLIHLLVTIAAIAWGIALVALPSEKTHSQPNFAGAEQQQKRLVIFLDGTWNDVDTNTNVWRMRALCASKGNDGKRA